MKSAKPSTRSGDHVVERDSEVERLRHELIRAHRRYTEVTQEFLAFQSVSNQLLHTEHLDDTLMAVLRGLEDGLGYSIGGVFVVDRREGFMFLRVRPANVILDQARLDIDFNPDRIRIPLDAEDNALIKVVRDQKVNVLRDMKEWLVSAVGSPDPQVVADFLERNEIRLIVAAPMLIGGEVGGLLLGATTQQGMTSTERESLQNLANQSGMAIENSQLVADLRRVRDELRDKNKALQELEQLKEGLVQMVVHDMKNPITSVRGYLELLLDEPDDRLSPDLRKHVKISYDSSGRLLNMVRDLLDISRMEEGKIQLYRKVVQLPEMIDEVVTQNRAQAQRQKKDIAIEIAPDLPPVDVDPDLIGRVIANLVSNAIKHTPSGSQITVQAMVDGPDFVRITVVDTGDGIPEDQHRRIFEKFSVVEGRRQGHRMNTGLGLTFCKLAVESHGGRIWLESAEGRGSTFHFTVPQVAPEGAED